MKCVQDIVLLTNPADSQSEVLRLALSGNIFCRARNAQDVREIVQCLAPEPLYDACYIQATFTNGNTEVFPPVGAQWSMTTLKQPGLNNERRAAA